MEGPFTDGPRARFQLIRPLERLYRTLTWLLIAAGCCLQTAIAQTGENVLSEADYVIEARVDDAEPSEIDDGEHKLLTGRLTLTWKNRSGAPATDLWFHLYLNAYANNRSLHLTESKGRLRGFNMDRGYGWQEVTSLTAGGTDLTDAITFRVPRGGAMFDKTLFSVDLPQPVADGEDVEVVIEWTSRLPRVRRRTGTKDDFIFLSHWFPKLGVFEGERGWRAHSFHMNTEFYADYGTYDVTLDLPGRYEDKVAASGAQVGETVVENDRAVSRFVAPSEEDRAAADAALAGRDGAERPIRVHGFAWTADPRYVVHERVFKWGEWATKYSEAVDEAKDAFGKTAEELAGRDVLIRVMIHPERAAQAERHWRATAATLFFYGLWYGTYPYAEITAVDPAWGARGAGGMEYPTIFTCGSRMFTEPSMYTPESVTVHEAGHQFWYGLVGNNEPEAAWLDEGFNSFSDSETLFRVYGPRIATTSYSGLPVKGRAPTPLPGGSPVANAIALRRFSVPNPVRVALDAADRKVAKEWNWLVPNKLGMRPLDVSGPIAYWRDLPMLTFVQQSDDPRWGDRSGYLRDPDSDPIETNVWDYVDARSYGTNSYPRTAVGLRSLQAVVGRKPFMQGMRKFSLDWRYRHPYPEDFYLAFQEGADAQLQWYFDAVFRGTETIDWSVQVGQTKEPKSEGWFRCEDGSWTADCSPERLAEIAQETGDASDTDASDTDAEVAVDEGSEGKNKAPERPYLYDVVLRRKGGLALPVSVRVTFDDGETRDFDWSREEQLAKRWLRLPLGGGTSKISSVIIDPERLWFLDQDMSDNQWFLNPDKLAPTRWGERALTRTSSVLQFVMSVGG